MQREDQTDHGNGPGTNSSESAVNHLSKSVVRENRTPRSVGTGGGQLPPVTRFAPCKRVEFSRLKWRQSLSQAAVYRVLRGVW